MIRLCRYQPELEGRYRPVIEGTMRELCTKYLANGGILLHGSWGNQRHATPTSLLEGKGRFPQEQIMLFGNYYFVEALYRELVEDWDFFHLGL